MASAAEVEVIFAGFPIWWYRESSIIHKVSTLKMLNCDETGVRVGGKLRWVHCMFDGAWGYYAVHDKRGTEAMHDIQVLPNMEGSLLVHDFLRSYLNKPQFLQRSSHAGVDLYP